MRIDWTFEAEALLDEYAERASGWSTGAGQRLVERIIGRVSTLQAHPLIGRVVPEYGLTRFRELIEPPYRIMYEVLADRVEIVAIRHSAELLEPAPPDEV